MNRIKVLIVTSSLGAGGAERSAALLSILLSDAGYGVHIVSVLDDIQYDYKGELLNLGALKNADDSAFGRLKRLLVLRKYLKKHNFDWIIDNRTRTVSWSEWIISKWIYPAKKAIYVVRNFRVDFYFPSHKFIAKRIYRESPYIVAVSKEAAEQVRKTYGYQNVITIYNPAANEKIIEMAHQNPVPGNFILSYGRLHDESKNLSLLIEAYAKSGLPRKNILLYILGDGDDLDKLKHKTEDFHLSDKIIFVPKQSNPFPYVKSALFTVLSSRYEGFPRVVIESLAIGTPVVSVDCSSGPKEIIQNGINGLLVENDNPEALADAMDRLADDHNLYHICKTNAQQSIAHLSPENILKEWNSILKK
ncbi:glycosyltransferase [Flavobacterium pallidum]|uniref:Glycosyltransferase n=1 Tax=Flavobacterium pallidum TaxID=2172098 RepID=A0A2S1SKT6_9FLAO|nr:glycosyltransferase [Flavobacterium pallidum]AWI27015.1 glycosyltransferase [Flavobacterium pallidum]